jgi:hypothetical protein
MLEAILNPILTVFKGPAGVFIRPTKKSPPNTTGNAMVNPGDAFYNYFSPGDGHGHPL